MAAGQTIITYGDMTILSCLTQPSGFSQEPVFDESNTDLLYYKFRVRVVGYIHGMATISVIGIIPNYGLNNGGNQGQTSASQAYAGIRYAIKPRQPFLMKMGVAVNANTGVVDLATGVPVLVANPIPQLQNPNQAASQIANITGYDVNDGPRCTHFDILHVTADNLFKVEVEFEICKVECDSNGNAYNTSGVLNNRWSVIDDLDENFITTRKFNGTLQTVSSTINANSFRAYVVPPLQPGMRRESMSFNVTTDGKKLRYEITDKETLFAAPSPATWWRIEHIEDATRESRLAVHGTVRVELRGDRNSDHKRLIPIAIAAAESKLLTKDNKTIIMGATIASIMGSDESAVTVAVRGMRVPKDGQALLGLPLALLGKPIAAADLAGLVPAYSKDLSYGARPGDNIEVQGPIQLVGAFAAYLQSNCSNTHQIYNAPQGQQTQNPPKTQPVPITGSVSESAQVTDDGNTSFYNNGSQTALYTFYQMESTYASKSNRAQMPIGISNSSSSNNTQPTCVVVDLGPRTMQRHVRISSERAGQMPDVPSMQDQYVDSGSQIQFTLLDTIDRSIVPDRTSDAKQMYKLDREYVYAMSRPPNPGESIPIGVDPTESSGSRYTRVYDPGATESQFQIA